MSKSEKIRRWNLMKKRGCFCDIPEGITIERAITIEDLCSAFRLVHDEFVEQGYIDPHPSGMRIRVYEASPETVTFIAKEEGKIVGVTSLVVDSPEFNLPAMNTFYDEIISLRQRGIKVSDGFKIVEGTNWAIIDKYRNTGILSELMRVCLSCGRVNNWDYILGAVSPTHSFFYDLMCFDIIGSERDYNNAKNDPVILESVDIKEFNDRMITPRKGDEREHIDMVNKYFLEDSPYMSKIDKWDQEARAVFANTEFLKELFINRTDFLSSCSPEEREKIYDCWNKNAGKEIVFAL
jgi:hypothetical protein